MMPQIAKADCLLEEKVDRKIKYSTFGRQQHTPDVSEDICERAVSTNKRILEVQ
jgi:hypothetical protein